MTLPNGNARIRERLVRQITGLYAVTPENSDTGRLAHKVEAALSGGTRIVQYRSKSRNAAADRAQADRILALCRTHQALFIINDDLELALATGADGLHIGDGDGDVAAVRARLPDTVLLGVSCYDQPALAAKAIGDGADYVAFGSVFASSVKPDAVRAPPELIARARPGISVPIVAIGGITLDNARSVIDAGADSLAVITALFDAPDIAATATSFQHLFERRPS